MDTIASSILLLLLHALHWPVDCRIQQFPQYIVANSSIFILTPRQALFRNIAWSIAWNTS